MSMLRCLFGRAGAEVTARLSFFVGSGKTTISAADLDEVTHNLRQLRPKLSAELGIPVDHGIDRLEQMANWMDTKNIAHIPLVAIASEVHA